MANQEEQIQDVSELIEDLLSMGESGAATYSGDLPWLSLARWQVAQNAITDQRQRANAQAGDERVFNNLARLLMLGAVSQGTGNLQEPLMRLMQAAVGGKIESGFPSVQEIISQSKTQQISEDTTSTTLKEQMEQLSKTLQQAQTEDLTSSTIVETIAGLTSTLQEILSRLEGLD